MGALIYGNSDIDVAFDDRALAHLQLVITAKLRRRESFVFSWTNSKDMGSGRSSIWIDSSIPLYFQYSGSRAPSINRQWVEILMDSANSAHGLVFVPEPVIAVAPVAPVAPVPQ
jgi:hypothetical protein